MKEEDYFLRKLVLRWVLRNGDLNLLSDRILVGLGCGHGVLHQHLADAENVTGEARTIEVYTGTYKGVRISTMSIPGGGVYAEWAARIAALRRAKAIVGVGFCGALREDIELGDVIVPTASARYEDTSDYYAPKSVPAVASFELVRRLVECLERYGLRIHVGPIVTTSSSLKEDIHIDTWRACRLLGVECETSVLLLICHVYGVPAATVLVVSDNAVTGSSYCDSPELERRVAESFSAVIRASLDVLASLR